MHIPANAESAENEHLLMWIEDGILFGVYKKGIVITVEVAKEMVKFRMDFQKGRSHPALLYIDGIKSIKPAAKEYLSSEGLEGIERAAFIVSRPVMSFIASLFIIVNKPGRPTKVFRNHEEALIWLKS